VSLGDNSSRLALSLALAKTGAGQGREALAILEAQRDSIPVSDLGLALALAGDSSRGVALLTDALRGGENTPKLRQNLAYAYALDGRWSDARIMMAQDVPADLIDQRITEWAMRAKPDDYRERVAGLIGAPLRSDPGQPVQLALANTPTFDQLAAEASATPPAPANAELAASTETQIPAPAYGLSEPAARPVVQSTFAESSAAPAPRAAAPAQARHRPARTVRITLPAAKPAAPKIAASTSGTHLVQLGSFSSEQSAKRAWNLLVARNPNLRGHRMVITPAVVDGKNYWRVAAAGFDAGTAQGACSTVKSRGGACFAYAASRVPAGAVTGFAQARLGKAIATRR
jgi:cell division septation protein DedD